MKLALQHLDSEAGSEASAEAAIFSFPFGMFK